ncbi:MAG: hypothetical protein ACRDP6_24585 [Actinoallomurus sp.]
MLTPEQLTEIEALVSAVPKAPWVIEGDYPQRITNAEALVIAECFEGPQFPPSIAEFIAHARTDVPALLAEVKRLREQMSGWSTARDIVETAVRKEYAIRGFELDDLAEALGLNGGESQC